MAQWSIDTRPKNLDDLYGLEPLKKYFHNRLSTGKDFPTSLLLTGKFGCAKTTSAKIIAAMMTCRHTTANFAPCGECPDCLTIMDDTFTRDVIQVNGTAEGKSDIIDRLEDFLLSPPMRGLRKVVIVEEAQALSAKAIQAFLKATETPKKRIHFIFTAMAKLKDPALNSRFVTFEFPPFPVKDILYYLKSTMEKANLWNDPAIPVEFRTKGLFAIAQNSDGSLRQAVQLLEQCLDAQIYDPADMSKFFLIVDHATVLNSIISAMGGALSEPEIDTLFRTDYQKLLDYLLKLTADAHSVSALGITADGNDYSKTQATQLLTQSRFNEFSSMVQKLSDDRVYIRQSDFIIALSDFISRGRTSVSTSPASTNSGANQLPVRSLPPRRVPS